MDDLFYDRIHQCQRNAVLALTEHQLYGESQSKAAIQPRLRHFRQFHGQDAGRCCGEQCQHGDGGQCHGFHHPQCHRVRTVLHQFSGDQKRQHDHLDYFRAFLVEGHCEPHSHADIGAEDDAAECNGIHQVVHRHFCGFVLQRVYADRQYFKQDRHCTDHGDQLCSDHKRIHLCRQLHDHKEPHGQRSAVRTGLLNPQSYTGNSDCEEWGVHF